jgi:TPR repeat protein
MALLEKAAGQGHAYAMHALGELHAETKEHEQAVGWFTMGAEVGLPHALYDLGRGLHSSTFRLNISAFCGIGGALRDC